MKRKLTLRAGVSLLLVLCMMLSIFPLAVFASEDDESRYASIGASNVNGYGLRGYIDPGTFGTDDAVMEAAALDSDIKAKANVLGYGRAPEESYPALVRDALESQKGKEVVLDQLAISSMRAEEVRILLDNDYDGDAYSAWRFIGEGKWFDIADGDKDGDFSDLRESYQNAVKNADLITVDIGANNFGVYLGFMLAGYLSEEANDLELVDPQIGKLYNSAKDQVESLFAEYGISLEEYEELADTLVYALVGFCYNFDKSMQRIYELNPDATVVVVSIQNLLAGVNAKLGDIVVPFGDIVGALINSANIYIASGSPYSWVYHCADVRKSGHVEFFIDEMAAYDGNPAHLSDSLIDCCDVLDGSPGVPYDDGYHIKYHVANYAVDKGWTTEDEVAEYLEGEGKARLDRAYNAYACYLRDTARIDTIDLPTLLADTGDIYDALTAAIWENIDSAVESAEYTLKTTDEIFEAVAEKCDTTKFVVETVAAYDLRTSIGNSFSAHPTPAGHETIADAILDTLAYEITGRDIMEEEIDIAIDDLFGNNEDQIKALAAEALQNFISERGTEALVTLQTYLVEAGWMTEEQVADLTPEIIEVIAAGFEEDPETATEEMVSRLVIYLYETAVEAEYIDPVSDEDVEKLAAVIEMASAYYDRKAAIERVKVEAVMKLLGLLEDEAVKRGYVEPEALDKFKSDLAGLMTILQNTNSKKLKNAVDSYIDSVKNAIGIQNPIKENNLLTSIFGYFGNKKTTEPEPLDEVDVSVSLSKQTSVVSSLLSKFGLGSRKTSKTIYSATINTKISQVKKVEYSTNGGDDWKVGSVVTAEEPIEDFFIRVTDVNGFPHVFEYADRHVSPVQIDY